MPDRSVLGSSPPRACRWAEGPGHGSGGPCSQGRLRLRLRPQLRPRRPARPRPPARSLPGLGEHSIHSPPAAAGRGLSRSRSRSQSQAGPGSRRRRRGDAGERDQAEGADQQKPRAPPARAAPPSGLWAATGQPAGRGCWGGAAGRGLHPGRPPPGLGAAPAGARAPGPWRPWTGGWPSPTSGGLRGVLFPRAGSPARRARPDCALVGPVLRAGLRNLPAPPQPDWSPRGPVTLADPPSASSWATSAPFPGPCCLPCDIVPSACGWLLSQQLVRSPGVGGSASEQGLLRGAAVSPRGPLPHDSGMRRLCHLVLLC